MSLELSVAGTREAINMVEAGANELDEETMLKAIMFAHEISKRFVISKKLLLRKLEKRKWSL